MRALSLRFWSLLASGFLAGVAFVLACGDTSHLIDAGAGIDAHAAACEKCEAPITPERLYYVRDRSSAPIAGHVRSLARCNSGDVAIGGGCWVYRPSSTDFDSIYDNEHVPVVFGPTPAAPGDPAQQPDRNDRYVCSYANAQNHTDMIVVATAICFHPAQ